MPKRPSCGASRNGSEGGGRPCQIRICTPIQPIYVQSPPAIRLRPICTCAACGARMSEQRCPRCFGSSGGTSGHVPGLHCRAPAAESPLKILFPGNWPALRGKGEDNNQGTSSLARDEPIQGMKPHSWRRRQQRLAQIREGSTRLDNLRNRPAALPVMDSADTQAAERPISAMQQALAVSGKPPARRRAPLCELRRPLPQAAGGILRGPPSRVCGS